MLLSCGLNRHYATLWFEFASDRDQYTSATLVLRDPKRRNTYCPFYYVGTTTTKFRKYQIMEYQNLIQTLEARSAEIKGAQSELAERIFHIEQKQASARGFNATSTEGSRFDVKSIVEALAQSGNMTCKSIVPANAKSILVQGNTSLMPTVANLGVFAAGEISLAAQLPSFSISEAIVRYSRLSTADKGAIQGAEGSLKHELAIDATPVEAECNTFAAWTAISTQALADQRNINDALGTVLSTGVVRAVNDHAFSVAQAQGTVGAVGATPLLTALTNAAAIQSQGFAASVYLNPADYVGALLATSTTGEFLDVPAAFVGVIKPAAGIPVGSFLATSNDGQGLSLAIRENLTIDIGVVGDQFIRNARTLLAEVRGLAIIKNPALVITGTLAKATK